jgi:hypothetical protein
MSRNNLKKARFNKLTLVVILLGLLLLVVIHTVKNLPEFTLIHEGYLPAVIDDQHFTPANLLGKQQEFIVVKQNAYFEVFQFTGNSWKSFYEIPFGEGNSKNAKIGKSIAWTIGDLNNNGKDEIIICIERTIKKYEWNGVQFKEMVYKFPYLTEDILIGDVNNDNLNDLVLFCYERPLNSEERGCKYYLCIAKLEKGRLSLLWTDKGKLGYVKSNVIPSDNLVCIADVENIGANQLVVAKGQSDVSPTKYNLLSWDKDELKFIKSLIISPEGDIITKGDIGAASFSIGDLKPIKIAGKIMLLVPMVDNNKFRQVIVKRENNGVIISKPIFEHSGWRFPNRIYWINLDGRGKGILRVINLGSGEVKYMFYRLNLLQQIKWCLSLYLPLLFP